MKSFIDFMHLYSQNTLKTLRYCGYKFFADRGCEELTPLALYLFKSGLTIYIAQSSTLTVFYTDAMSSGWYAIIGINCQPTSRGFFVFV